MASPRSLVRPHENIGGNDTAGNPLFPGWITRMNYKDSEYVSDWIKYVKDSFKGKEEGHAAFQVIESLAHNKELEIPNLEKFTNNIAMKFLDEIDIINVASPGKSVCFGYITSYGKFNIGIIDIGCRRFYAEVDVERVNTADFETKFASFKYTDYYNEVKFIDSINETMSEYAKKNDYEVSFVVTDFFCNSDPDVIFNKLSKQLFGAK
jgi:hypothetical protein